VFGCGVWMWCGVVCVVCGVCVCGVCGACVMCGTCCVYIVVYVWMNDTKK